jgi:teichuronic acid biosynthesis glycosyltransferase TuaC
VRILTFTTLFPNSLAPDFGVFLLQRVSHLAGRSGNDVEVVAPLPYAPGFLRGTSRGYISAVPKTERIAGLRVHHPRYPLLPGISMPAHGLLMYAGCLNLMRSLHQQQPFDCIDAHYVFPDGLAAVLLGKSLRLPVMLTARGSDIHTFPKFTTIRPQICWTLRNATRLAAVSPSLAQIMLELEPSIPRPEVIGNGVDTMRFYPEDRLLARAKIGVDPNIKLIVSVAALKHVKGIDLLVRAASLLKKSTPQCRLLFIGKGPDLSTLQRLASQLDCADTCKFVGPVANDKLRDFYNAADVTCLPSRNEGWPNVVLESLACGTPVVGTRVGAVPELLSDAGSGVLVNASAESIHQGLCEAVVREWNRDAIAARARSHSWDKVAERVEALLQHHLRPERAVLEKAVSV